MQLQSDGFKRRQHEQSASRTPELSSALEAATQRSVRQRAEDAAAEPAGNQNNACEVAS